MARWAALGLCLLLAACTGPASSSRTGPPLTDAGVRQALVDTLGPLWFCDPDQFPIVREDEVDAARERWPEVLADHEALEVITTALGIAPAGEFTDDQKLAVYRLWKVLNAIALERAGDAVFRFDYLIQPAAGAAEGRRVSGTIDRSGVIAIEREAPAGEPVCPICLALGTPIETPAGVIRVEGLRIGDPIWTLDDHAQRVVGTVIGTASTAAPAGHEVIRLELADGRVVTASARHPLADGRLLGSLRAGDAVDTSTVRSATRVPYAGARTFDLAVSGPTGAYLSNGIPLASTID